MRLDTRKEYGKLYADNKSPPLNIDANRLKVT